MHHTAGFTIVEMLVTVALAGIFLTFFIQMYRATNAQQLSLIRQSTANDIAKSNLAKFPTAASVKTAACAAIGAADTRECGNSSPRCDTTGTSTNSFNNLAIRADAPGTAIIGVKTAGGAPIVSITEPDPGNLGTVTQTVRAYWPQGCGAGDDVPIKVNSRVDYVFGDAQTNSVEYSTYVF